jgi:hypothetical protein
MRVLMVIAEQESFHVTRSRGHVQFDCMVRSEPRKKESPGLARCRRFAEHGPGIGCSKWLGTSFSVVQRSTRKASLNSNAACGFAYGPIPVRALPLFIARWLTFVRNSNSRENDAFQEHCMMAFRLAAVSWPSLLRLAVVDWHPYR